MKLKKIIKESNEYSGMYRGTTIIITGMEKALAKQVAPQLAHILKTKTEIGNLNLRKIKLEY